VCVCVCARVIEIRRKLNLSFCDFHFHFHSFFFFLFSSFSPSQRQVAIHFLPATSLRCLIEPWLREIGFIICYGAIVLKLYRHLVEFRTRKAHRWVVRDLDLLRYLCAMIVAVLCYLAAFAALCLDYLKYSELIWNVTTENVATSNMCKPLKWDYVSMDRSAIVCHHKFLIILSFFSLQPFAAAANSHMAVACLLMVDTTGDPSRRDADIDLRYPIVIRQPKCQHTI